MKVGGQRHLRLRLGRRQRHGDHGGAGHHGFVSRKEFPWPSSISPSRSATTTATAPLIDGAVQIDGVDPVFMKLYAGGDLLPRLPRRGVRHLRMVAVELHGEDRAGQLSLCRGAGLRVAHVPPHLDLCAAPTASRSRRTSRAARSACRNISSPPTSGRAPSWKTTSASSRSDIHWIRGGIEHAGRPEKITIKLPEGVRLDNAPEGKTISELLDERRDRRLHRAAAADAGRGGHPHIGWLFRDPVAAAKDYYKRTGIFPIMHLIGVRRDAGREASLAAGGGAEGLRAVEGRRDWRICPTPRRPR